MDLGLAGATAVVTGGSKGMGRAVAETLAAEGAKVAVMARGKEALDDTVAALEEAGAPEALGIVTDFADADSIAAAFAQVEQAWGSLNSLVHTVGPGGGTFETLTDDDWEAAFELGTTSAVRSIRASLPLLRQAEWARIVTFGAQSVRLPNARMIAYSASKAALASVTKNLAKSLAPEGILVNCVCPGTFLTTGFQSGPLTDVLAGEGLDPTSHVDVMTWIDKNFDGGNSVKRAGLPDEIASLTAYLASRRNSFVTGATVNADGGSDF